MKRLLVVTHSRSGGTRALADAALGGARDPEAGGDAVEVVERGAFDAGPDDVLGADALLLATPEHFGYMSGALKDFFERIYYPCLDHTRGRPYGLIVKGGNDGSGTVLAVERIVAGLGWRLVASPVVAVGDVTDAHRAAAGELGATLSAGLALDIW